MASVATQETEQPLSEETARRKDLILRNLQEALGVDKLTKQLSTEGKVPHVYWGTATTGRPHVGYLVPMRKIADLLQSGLRVTILFADLHAFLDNMKSTWELLENRVIYYEYVIKALLQSLEVPIDRLHFVRGTSYQLTKEYTNDILRLCALVSQRDALKAGAEVVKQVDSPLLSGLLYPLLQALDEQYLKVDGQFGGVDQRKIFILAEEQLPKLKLGKRWHLMNPMVPGLTGSKMSSSEEDSKIDVLDEPAAVRAKIAGASCPRDQSDNGVLAFFNYVLFPIVSPDEIVVANKKFDDFASLQKAFTDGVLSEGDLKEKLSDFLVELLEKVRSRCDNDAVRAAKEKGYQNVINAATKTEVPPPVSLTEEMEATLRKILGEDEAVPGCETLRAAVAAQKPLKVLFVVHGRGNFHLGFVGALLKIKQIVNAGIPVEATLLVSPIEAFLDNEKVSWAAQQPRAVYYAEMLRSFVKTLGLESSAKVVIASDLPGYFDRDYVLDFYKMASAVTRDEATICEGTSLSGSLVPLTYALNLRLVRPDVVLIGDDAVVYAKLTEKLLSFIGSHTYTHIVLPTIPGCDGAKMSCSRRDFLLDPLETPKQIKTKIARSFCEPGNLEGNVAMQLAKIVVFPSLEGRELLIPRTADNGGDVVVKDYKSLEHEFTTGSNPAFPLHPGDLKSAIVGAINEIFNEVRSDFSTKAKLVTEAFPTIKGGKKK
ncbi:unnamed protein product [Caenorhabditis auriculariae]|uniref:Tyrosine--tRNA ligase n=1 Tax=Caenorhabditis auriculariae TaxID=2777116 RepID=A0A8S1GMC7_9PELO|nr:unnamed protein product [Caenorhabditis auriculariae]